MSNTYGLTKDNLLWSLPAVLQQDRSVHALAEGAAEELSKLPSEVDQLTIYPRIDTLPEDLLDILAQDFKVDWWDYNYTLAEKRQTLKDSFLVHRRLGTKWAIQTALSAIYPDSTVEPWFTYGGDPYYFRLCINTGNKPTDFEQQNRVLELAKCYQGLRDRMDEIRYTVEAEKPDTIRCGGCFSGAVILCLPELTDVFHFDTSIRVGAISPMLRTLPVPEFTGERKEGRE